MTARLPIPGGDNGDWGGILNSFLEVSHNQDGTLASNTVGVDQLQDGSVTNAQLDSTTQNAIAKASSSAPLASPTFTGTPAAPTATATDNSTTLATTSYVNSIAPFLAKGVFDVMHPKYGAKGDGSTNDTAAINSAISDYNSNGGGVLLFPRSSSYYITNGGHTISAPGIIAGQGYGTIGTNNGSTVLYLANGSNANMFNLASKAITMLDIGLYGNLSNQSSTSYGIITSVSTACNYFRIQRVWVDSFYSDGIYLQGPGTSLEGFMYGLKLTNNGAHGINFSAGSAADCQLTASVMSQNVLSGAYVNASDTVFADCHLWGNGSSTSPPTSGDVGGIFMPSGAGGGLRVTGGFYETNGNATAGGQGIRPRGQANQITGARISSNRQQGIYAYSNTNLTITGCIVNNNNLNAASGANGAGIEFDTCTASSVTGCSMYDTNSTKVQTYGYSENGNTCNACLFSNNVSRAVDNKTGNWLIGTGNPTATIPSTPASYNVG